ncbi:MAG: hypothetical protein K2N94_07770 [Lachnospiraceae bacterium]|nr:hypothetical protein [Lachnospiraceae bacterium]
MKDRNYFPFERNRYFFGKLLSVEDFEREQAYMNHKRRMLNRLLYGDGVLCGLQVLEVDEESISVEMGVALDSLGREIVMEQPVIKRLSVLDGFREHCVENGNGGILYLCIEYSEEAAEPVHCIGSAGDDGGKPLEFNKWREGCRLFLTSEEPEGNQGFADDACEEIHTVYRGRGIRIRLAVPRFMTKDREAVLRLLVDKNGNREEISFRFDVELEGADWQGKKRMTLEFREAGREQADFYQEEYTVCAALRETEGRLQIAAESFVLEIGGHKRTEAAGGKFRFEVVSGSRERALRNAFLQSAPEDLLQASRQPLLYLARITVIQAGDTYIIERVDNLPYRQYVWNNRLLGALRLLGGEPSPDREKEREKPRPAARPEPAMPGLPVNYVYGLAEIELGIGGAAGQCFFSEEIVHGLGPGNVIVTVGAVNPRKDGREIVYGTRNIFPEEKGQVNVETAVKLYVDKGSFRIGVRCLKEVHEGRLTVHWLAVLAQKEAAESRPSMNIRPGLPRIRVRETLNFEALIDGKRQTRIHWEVREPEGGSIDAKGLYTAPNHPGIFEIRAADAADGSLRASVYVIVAEGTE